jgi:patatin-like phospholipase/acyl hydrolase
MRPPRFSARTEISTLKPYNSGLTLEDVAARVTSPRIAKLASNENPAWSECSDHKGDDRGDHAPVSLP